jgi:hypothetical protein
MTPQRGGESTQNHEAKEKFIWLVIFKVVQVRAERQETA